MTIAENGEKNIIQGMEIEEILKKIPKKDAGDSITPGCMVLEGGAWRGLYSEGVLDYLMEKDVNLQTVIGVSAGALGGMNYVSGQIGRSARINLSYRHDRNYVGLGAMRRDHGITGFSYLWGEINGDYPLNEERFFDKRRRFVAVITNIETGKAEYIDRDETEDIYKVLQASASVPYVTEAVEIDGSLYLDGGLGDKIPYDWALNEGYDKVIVIRTRHRDFRKNVGRPLNLTRIEYRKYPEFKKDLDEEPARYNLSVERLNMLEENGTVFVISPSEPIEIPRFEGNLDSLYHLYELGRKDGEEQYDRLMEYLEKKKPVQ